MKMQAFHKWLFAAKPSREYQRHLEALTHFSCKQLQNATRVLTWDIWSAETPAPTA